METQKIEMTVNYTKPISLDKKDLELDEEIDFDEVEIKSENENIATVDGLVIKGNSVGNTILDVYYKNKLKKKIKVEIKNENKEEQKSQDENEKSEEVNSSEVKIVLESHGKKDERIVKVENGELQEKLSLKKDDILTIERVVPEEISNNDFANKLRNSSSIEIMNASMGQKDGKRTSVITYKVLEDVEF